MAPKAKAAAAKKESKAEKPAKKAAKSGEEIEMEMEAATGGEAPAVDQDELEEAEEEAAASPPNVVCSGKN